MICSQNGLPIWEGPSIGTQLVMIPVMDKNPHLSVWSFLSLLSFIICQQNVYPITVINRNNILHAETPLDDGSDMFASIKYNLNWIYQTFSPHLLRILKTDISKKILTEISRLYGSHFEALALSPLELFFHGTKAFVHEQWSQSASPNVAFGW